MGIESILSSVVSSASNAATSGRVIELGPSGSAAPNASDAGRFAASLDRAGSVGSVTEGGMSAPVGKLLGALDGIDVQARSVADYARTSEASGGQLTPGEIVQLTMRCQEFMFQCQLTSNIANRSADGVQQLFRQQG